VSTALPGRYNEDMARGKATRRKRAGQQARWPPAGRSRTPPPKRRGVDRRRWVLGAVVAAIVVAVVVGAVRARGGDESADEGATLTGAGEAIAVFDGIAQNGVVLGPPDAPVTLVEYFDLQCPFCREFAVESVPTIVDKHVRTGKVRVELRGLAFIGPDSARGMRAALAAAQQDRMFELAELLFYNQGPENAGWLSQELIEAAARSLPGLDVARLVEEMDSDAVSDLLAEHAQEAERRGVRSTPTIFVGPTGGELKRVQRKSATDVASIDKAIAAASS
jgi:protein-disulfide isomerase